MSKLIVCLGYRLQSDGSMSPVLENRLKDVVRLCDENKNSTLLLMGASPYGNFKQDKTSEASLMREYLENGFKQEIEGTKIITEETTTSTVEQMCYLKKFIQAEKLNYSDIIVVSSEFFNERVKLYAEYVFGTIDGIIFVGSSVPGDMAEEFKKAESDKFKEGLRWLSGHEKGDEQTILKEQKEFQNKVISGEFKQPPIS